MATTPTPKKPVPPRKPLVSAEPKPVHTPTIPVEPPMPVAPIAPAIPPSSAIGEPTPAADAQAAQAPVTSPVKSLKEEIPPIPNNANGEPLYTMFSWTRKLRREGKIKG